MTVLKPEVDAAEVGLDPTRLERLDRHFARYVDDGRLPGWLITVSRYGRLALVARCGSRRRSPTSVCTRAAWTCARSRFRPRSRCGAGIC